MDENENVETPAVEETPVEEVGTQVLPESIADEAEESSEEPVA